MHILHVEAGQIEAVSHFAVAVDAFLADNGCLDAAFCLPILLQAVSCEASREFRRNGVTHRLTAVVVEALLSLLFAALFAVEKI